jgi:5'-AMP-activated protein kinase regulatory gamma subunit
VRKALTALLQNNIHAAPLWNSQTGYAGMLTVTDFIHLVRFHYHSHSSYESAMKEINECTIEYLKRTLLGVVLNLSRN